jgi:hypothetical protein
LFRPHGGPGEQLAQAEGTVQLGRDKELLATAVIGIPQEGEGAFIAGRSRFQLKDGGFQGEPEPRADVNGCRTVARLHGSSPPDSSFSCCCRF